MTSAPGSRRRALVAILIVLGLAVAAERGRWFGRLMGLASPRQTWIWVAASPRAVMPRAFLLARDFDLSTVPTEAWLAVAGDPEYIVRLNGRRIGSGVYRPGSTVDSYAVAGDLRVGRNRLLLELRSPIGAGGATARLTGARGEPLAASDDGWRVYEGSWRALGDLERPLAAAPRAVVLGESPLARWGILDVVERPTYAQLAAGDTLQHARRWRPALAEGTWRVLRRGGRLPPEAGDIVEIDFGAVVTGYLHLDLDRRATAEGMVFFAEAAGAGLGRDPDCVIVGVPHLGFWNGAEPRRFRYATVVGIDALRGVSYIPMVPEAVPPATTLRSTGVLGRSVDAARSPLVEELRRRLIELEEKQTG